jgi:hypothetical protein
MTDERKIFDESYSETSNSLISPTPITPLTPMSTLYFDSPPSSKNISPTLAFVSSTSSDNKDNNNNIINNNVTFELNLSPSKTKEIKQFEVTSIPLTPTTPTTSISIEKDINNLTPRTQQILMTLDKPIESRGKSHNLVSEKRNKVQEQAFIDTIIDIQNKAKEVDQMKYMEYLKNLSLEKSLKAQKEKNHNNKLQLQKDLDKQIELYHKKMNDEKISRREGRVVSI